ncbi:LysR family transcriptional regulator [Sporosarcina gallistercoris]|uniref:LysR family transcriptional regulator n=1 Tax=Sporosarcina gallistercoris TaxID=2762245 RepID=A0ABR8PHI3_9BACL|nr:LysR family transcriptional regulator [Sporosarcina gallistercoris]MBD7907622.1 LysR family transcriptional regulator [Sporosarcina gallistercoris]
MDQSLNVFVTVAEKKNFSRAAEDLHMTQPAVSQYIRSLEETMDVRLLERTNKYVRLTKAGEIVYHHAKEIVGLYGRMHHLVNDLSHEASGKLSIGASYTFGEYVLPHMLARLLVDYPRIQPEVTIGNTAEIADLIISRQLDVGIVEGRFKENQTLATQAFAEDRMILVASSDHPLALKTEMIEWRELEDLTWIIREEGSGTREAVEAVFERFSINPARTMQFSSTQPIKEAVEAGLGVSLLSEWAVQKEIRYGDLVQLSVEGLPFVRQFSIVTSSPYQTKALQVFLELLLTNYELTLFREK